MPFSKETQILVDRYGRYLDAWKPLNPGEKVKVREALLLAAKAHEGIVRKSGEPYLIHPLEVARIVAREMELDSTSIICALLHDVVEDTDYTLEDITQKFDSTVSMIIDGLTKIPDEFMDDGTKSRQAENFKKVLMTLTNDVRVILIKLADRLHNMRTMDAMPHHKQLKISSETMKIYAPLAYRFGYYGIKNELEDLSFKYTNHSIYKSIANKLYNNIPERKSFITEFKAPLKNIFEALPYKVRIISEDKSIFSILSKMKKRQVSFENVDDTFNIKIIVDYEGADNKEICFLVYSKITGIYPPHIFKIRDWISSPKPNGYQALHTTVMSKTGRWVEVQIMTRKMYDISERGYAAYLRFHQDNQDMIGKLGTKNWLDRVKDMIDETDTDAVGFVDDFSGFLATNEIHVFTPQGELRNLPVNSTVLDFAYAIHTDIGNKCIAARVNHKIASINQQLKGGDQVEIITSDKQEPSDEWYDYVVTARAKTRIKDALRVRKKRLEQKGEQKLMRYFEKLQLQFTDEVIGRLQKRFKYQNRTDLLYDIYRDTLTIEDVKTCCIEEKDRWINNLFRVPKILRPSTNKKSLSETLIQKIKEKKDLLVMDKDVSELNYDLAKCCLPIPGDNIISIINDEEDITIHRTNCPQAINLMARYGDRIIKTRWQPNESIGFLSGIQIDGLDKQGFIQEVTNIINTNYNLNIHAFHVETDHGLLHGNIMLYVYSVDNLKQLINSLKKLKNVNDVNRINPLDAQLIS